MGWWRSGKRMRVACGLLGTCCLAASVMITLFPRPTAGKGVDEKFEDLLEDWAEQGWKEAGPAQEELYGWTMTMKAEFSGLQFTRTSTFTPLLFLGGQKSVVQVAGKILTETTRKVKNDDGYWGQKFLPEDNPFAEAAELHGEKQLSPKASYALSAQYYDRCLEFEKSMEGIGPVPLVDEKFKITCEYPMTPKDSNGDLVADGGLTDAEVEGYLEAPECVTVIKQYDDGTTYEEEECE